MNMDRFVENIIEQIKEVQLKLGYVKEVIRLYYPVESLNSLLQTDYKSGRELIAGLECNPAFTRTVLGNLEVSLCKGERIAVSVPPEGTEYVEKHVPNPEFLAAIIELFQKKHDLTIEEICHCFESFNPHYVCEKMKPENDFDYVLYFSDKKPDSWYYCVRMEMGHTIYHRFTEEDYRLLIQ